MGKVNWTEEKKKSEHTIEERKTFINGINNIEKLINKVKINEKIA